MADKDGSGAIDMEELKHCLKELKVEISEKDVEELHAESDMDSSHAIEFKEFIVLLALVYLLGVSVAAEALVNQANLYPFL
jgi:Ca2+-binding EF-hand superfamily protein